MDFSGNYLDNFKKNKKYNMIISAYSTERGREKYIKKKVELMGYPSNFHCVVLKNGQKMGQYTVLNA